MPNRYNRLSNQGPAQSQLEANEPHVGRSAFDCSFIHNGNTLIGALTPVACFDTVPNEDFDINLSALLEFRNPTTRQLFNGFRIYFHARWNRLSDLWEGAKNWLDLGRSGKISLARPNAIFRVVQTTGSRLYSANACTPMSLLNFLGLPAEVLPTKYLLSSHSVTPLRYFQACVYDAANPSDYYVSLNNHVDYFPADCLMAYQRNWRDFYCNKNLLQNNKYWFPDNEDHFILSYSCENAVCIKYEDEDFSSLLTDTSNEGQLSAQFNNLSGGEFFKLGVITPEPNNPSTSANVDFGYSLYPNLAGLKFVQFRGDRFTTGCPFPDLIRGDIPALESLKDVYSKVVVAGYDPSSSFSNGVGIGLVNKSISNSSTLSGSIGNFAMSFDTAPEAQDAFQSSWYSLLAKSNFNVTMSDIYTLETLTAFKRKMGMTNGDYNDMIEAQFGYNPHVHDRKGTYVGGFYQDFAMSSVTQTSQSDQSPLGTKAGQGVSSGNGRIGHFHSPDYGWLQVYMFVVPDVYYTQGKPRMFSKKSNLEMYFPLFNNLPAQAIRNDELFVTGDETTDTAPFAYEDRYAEYKSMPNRVSGLMALSHDVAEYDSSRIMARRFSSAPALNSQFITLVPENQDMEVFSVYDEPPFDFSIGFSVRRVSPMPYVAIEGHMSSPALN